MATTCAPVLIRMGIPSIAAHMFVFYFGIVADITPPVALAAYAGAAIAHGSPMKTGVNATKLAIAAFIIPYILALNPAMVFVNTTALTKWVVNKKGTQTAVWGKLGSAIVKELEGSVDVLTLGLAKLSAFFQVEKDMLDLGPMWVDRYIRAILTDALAVGFEAGIIAGNGKDMPIGMIMDIDGGTDGEGKYSKKDAIPVVDFSPASYGDLISRLAVVPVDEGEDPKYRAVDGLVMAVNPLDYYKVVMPATTIQTPEGRYINDVLPYPTKIIQSSAVDTGEAVLGMGKRYFMGVGTGKNGKIEYSDEFAFLDDLRTYKIKAHATGRAKDNNAFLRLDISGLSPAFYTVNVNNRGSENP
jgi:hypothetical protein